MLHMQPVESHRPDFRTCGEFGRNYLPARIENIIGEKRKLFSLRMPRHHLIENQTVQCREIEEGRQRTDVKVCEG